MGPTAEAAGTAFSPSRFPLYYSTVYGRPHAEDEDTVAREQQKKVLYYERKSFMCCFGNQAQDRLWLSPRCLSLALSLSRSRSLSRSLSPTHTTHIYNTHTLSLPPPLTHSTRQSAPQLRTYSRTICCPYLEIHQVICPGLHILHLAVQIITGTNSNSRPTRVQMVQVCRAPGDRERERDKEKFIDNQIDD